MSSPSGLRIVMVTCGQHLAAGARIPFLPGQPPTYEVKLSDLAGRFVQDGALPDAARTTLLGQLRVVVLSRPFLIAGQARRRGSYRAGYLSRRIPLLAKKTYSARTVQALLYVNMMLQRLWEAYVRTTKNGR
jgi:hypothetical protein